jgi:hypothetical protein
MPRSASDVLIEMLKAWGVDVIFGMPGDGIRGPATAEFLLIGLYTASATIKQAAYAAP